MRDVIGPVTAEPHQIRLQRTAVGNIYVCNVQVPVAKGDLVNGCIIAIEQNVRVGEGPGLQITIAVINISIATGIHAVEEVAAFQLYPQAINSRLKHLRHVGGIQVGVAKITGIELAEWSGIAGDVFALADRDVLDGINCPATQRAIGGGVDEHG